MDDRTYLAGLAMSGMLASQNTDTLETITNDSVIAADMLLKALRDSGHSLSPKSTTAFVNSFDEVFPNKETSDCNGLRDSAC